jgi:glycerol-3-phosphate dehydrogenase (NAD(P)+)
VTKIGIVGLGSWGTALGHHLACCGHDVIAWGREPSTVESINLHQQNNRYLDQAKLNPNLKASTEINDVCAQDVTLLAFPSAKLAELVPKLKFSSNTIVLSAIKGFESESLKTVSQYVESYHPALLGTAVLSGPSFAKDLVSNRPCGIVFASAKEEVAKFCAELFVSPTMRVFTSDDLLGVEIGGAVKNVIAIAAGACDGLQLGESARAGLITRGLAEMMRLAEALGAKEKTLAGLSGLGDLIMTATSQTSRNYRVGLLLAQGLSLQQALDKIGTVAEGVSSASCVQRLAQKFNVRASITDHVVMLLNGAKPTEMIASLLQKPVKAETD